ncbi:hypothetical protein [Rhizobium leguminosarum]|nr:hypothetical protein [Rhizobium leguminosarum]
MKRMSLAVHGSAHLGDRLARAVQRFAPERIDIGMLASDRDCGI